MLPSCWATSSWRRKISWSASCRQYGCRSRPRAAGSPSGDQAQTRATKHKSKSRTEPWKRAMIALVMWMCRAAKKCDGAAGAAEVRLVSPDKSCHLRVGLLCDENTCSPPVILLFYFKADSSIGVKPPFFLYCISILLPLLSQLVSRSPSRSASHFRGSSAHCS